eukprot:801042-Amphidinium_carterae.1
MCLQDHLPNVLVAYFPFISVCAFLKVSLELRSKISVVQFERCSPSGRLCGRGALFANQQTMRCCTAAPPRFLTAKRSNAPAGLQPRLFSSAGVKALYLPPKQGPKSKRMRLHQPVILRLHPATDLVVACCCCSRASFSLALESSVLSPGVLDPEMLCLGFSLAVSIARSQFVLGPVDSVGCYLRASCVH